MKNPTVVIPWFLLGLVIIGCSLWMHFGGVPTADHPGQQNNAGRIVRMVKDTPAETTYTGEKRKVSRKVEVARIFSPFGVSAGEAIAHQEPMTINEGATPGINITPEGIATTRGGGTETTTGGFRWGFFDSIWLGIKNFLWIGAIAIGILLLVYFLVPGAAPVISGLFRGMASAIPFVGSIVERITAKFKLEKPLVQTVAAGQSYKDEIDKRNDLTDVQKTELKKLFNDTMAKKQDETAQAVIKNIKNTLT